MAFGAMGAARLVFFLINHCADPPAPGQAGILVPAYPVGGGDCLRTTWVLVGGVGRPSGLPFFWGENLEDRGPVQGARGAPRDRAVDTKLLSIDN